MAQEKNFRATLFLEDQFGFLSDETEENVEDISLSHTSTTYFCNNEGNRQGPNMNDPEFINDSEASLRSSLSSQVSQSSLSEVSSRASSNSSKNTSNRTSAASESSAVFPGECPVNEVQTKSNDKLETIVDEMPEKNESEKKEDIKSSMDTDPISKDVLDKSFPINDANPNSSELSIESNDTNQNVSELSIDSKECGESPDPTFQQTYVENPSKDNVEENKSKQDKNQKNIESVDYQETAKVNLEQIGFENSDEICDIENINLQDQDKTEVNESDISSKEGTGFTIMKSQNKIDLQVSDIFHSTSNSDKSSSVQKLGANLPLSSNTDSLRGEKKETISNMERVSVLSSGERVSTIINSQFSFLEMFTEQEDCLSDSLQNTVEKENKENTAENHLVIAKMNEKVSEDDICYTSSAPDSKLKTSETINENQHLADEANEILKTAGESDSEQLAIEQNEKPEMSGNHVTSEEKNAGEKEVNSYDECKHSSAYTRSISVPVKPASPLLDRVKNVHNLLKSTSSAPRKSSSEAIKSYSDSEKSSLESDNESDLLDTSTDNAVFEPDDKVPLEKNNLSEQEPSNKFVKKTVTVVRPGLRGKTNSISKYHRDTLFVPENIIEKVITLEKTNLEQTFGFHFISPEDRTSFNPPYISTVEAGSIAEEKGLEENQTIITVNNEHVSGASEMEIVELIKKDSLKLVLGLGLPTCPPPRKSGYLKKLSTTFMKTWNTRWFELKHDNCLYYYKNKKDCSPTACIYLNNYSVEKCPEIDLMTFKLAKYNHNTYVLKASSAVEMAEWGSVITKASEARTRMYPELTSHHIAMSPIQIRDPDCYGFLYKKNSKGLYQKRYCVLKDASLYYYLDSIDKNARGVLHLHGYKCVSEFMHIKKFGFTMSPPEIRMKTFSFTTENEADRKRWISHLTSTINKWKPSETSE